MSQDYSGDSSETFERNIPRYLKLADWWVGVLLPYWGRKGPGKASLSLSRLLPSWNLISCLSKCRPWIALSLPFLASMVIFRFWPSQFRPSLLAMSSQVTPPLEPVLVPQRLGPANEKQLPTRLLRKRPRKPRGDLQAGSKSMNLHLRLLLQLLHWVLGKGSPFIDQKGILVMTIFPPWPLCNSWTPVQSASGHQPWLFYKECPGRQWIPKGG
jgi:hypothetical protein